MPATSPWRVLTTRRSTKLEAVRLKRRRHPSHRTAMRCDRPYLAAAPPSGVEGTGSNNWVLAGSAHHHRQAASGQRSAPEAQRASALVLRAHRGARPEGGRRHDAGPAVCGAGPERTACLGLHATPAPMCRISTLSAFDADRPATRVDTPEGPQPFEQC